MTSKKPRNRRTQRRLGGEETVAREIAELSSLDAEALRQQWVRLLGDDPPLTLGRSTLIQTIAANRAVFKAEPADTPDLVGVALRGAKRDVDKATKGLALHP